MINFWINSVDISGSIFIPKYYDPSIKEEINALRATHDLYSIRQLIEYNQIQVNTGDEIGKMAYGTGDIPFVRTSDLSNWEIKSVPKQGVSEEIYESYSVKQDVREGDILLVRDGTYLIGTNCFITKLDQTILYQSHILKFRILDKEKINPFLFFLSLNSPIVQKQLRSIQFTADIIDTIGNRYMDIYIPIPKNTELCNQLINSTQLELENRVKGKSFLKQLPVIIEKVLISNSLDTLNEFERKSTDEIVQDLKHDTITGEFGEFQAFWLDSSLLNNQIYLPKYYDPSISIELEDLSKHCDNISIESLKQNGIIELSTGDEIGKMAYGTGIIPFYRTSDFANFELKHDPKQGISEDIYQIYATKEDIQPNDIFLVRDGTYLIGTSCMVTEHDSKALYCGGLYKIRVNKNDIIDPWLLLALLNSYIVKRQIRTKQFTRDVIDTIGKRIDEVVIPIPRSKNIRKILSQKIKHVIDSRIESRNNITTNSLKINEVKG